MQRAQRATAKTLYSCKDSKSLQGTFLPEEGWRGREIFGLAKEESRVKGLGNGYF